MLKRLNFFTRRPRPLTPAPAGLLLRGAHFFLPWLLKRLNKGI
jgi:hypothetical protein